MSRVAMAALRLVPENALSRLVCAAARLSAAGPVTGWRYLPGRLWPVNPLSVRTVPRLFCANERLVTLLESPLGLCALVAVGATVVGRVRAYYDPTIPLTNRPGARPLARNYP